MTAPDALKRRAVSNGLASAISHFLQFFLNLLGIALLARLLRPEDFGLVAMVTVVMGFLRVFNEAGLATATIQRDGITHAQVSNLFWANIGLGLLSSLALAGLSPAVAWFYQQPAVTGVCLALACAPLLSTAAVQHRALLTREMRFTTLAFIDVSSVAAGVAISVVLARRGAGHWSLVGQQLAPLFLSAALVWWRSSWRPARPSRSSGTRPLLAFGANLTAGGFLWSVSRGLDGLLLGRIYGPDILGIYTRAGALIRRPVEQFMAPLDAVLIPVLSRLQQHPSQYRRVVMQVQQSVVLTSGILTAVMLGLATPITLLVLGEQWRAAVPIVSGFTVLAFYVPVGSVAGWILKSQGRGRDFLMQSFVGSGITLASTVVGLPFGAVGVAASYSTFCLLVSLPVLYRVAGRQGPVTQGDLWHGVIFHLPVPVAAFVGASGGLWILGPSSELVQIAVGTITGVAAGLIAVFVSPPSRAVAASVLAMVSELRPHRADDTVAAPGVTSF